MELDGDKGRSRRGLREGRLGYGCDVFVVGYGELRLGVKALE